MKKDIIISTTDVLKDYDIKEYCGYIDATSTIGSGFITDIASNWTDAFGVKSKAIENKIHLIKIDVINKLSEKAKRMKCNAILGLNVDVDEISSGQRMIFMVTASGTAVKCEKINGESMLQSVSGNYIFNKISKIPQYKNQLSDIKNKLINGDSNANNEFEEFLDIILEKEAFDFIERDFLSCLIENAFSRSSFNVLSEKILDIFESFDSNKLSYSFLDIMFELSNNTNKILGFRKTKSYDKFFEYFSSIVSLELINDFMKKGNDYFSVIVIYPLLRGYKESYTDNDLNILKEIIFNLKSKYWNDEIVLSNNDRICICGNVIHGDNPCSCGKTSSISASTYESKTKVVNHLNVLIKELSIYFKK